eukprot:COSAG05_NODE_191_length_14617_cov_90.240736_19_plen_130_part_00
MPVLSLEMRSEHVSAVGGYRWCAEGIIGERESERSFPSIELRERRWVALAPLIALCALDLRHRGAGVRQHRTRGRDADPTPTHRELDNSQACNPIATTATATAVVRFRSAIAFALWIHWRRGSTRLQAG